MPLIDSKYIIVVHDIFIILNCDSDKLIQLCNIVEKNNIDRLSLNVFKASEYYIDDNKLAICNLNTPNIQTNSFVPFDVRPSIWNKESLFALWSNHPYTIYRGCENDSVQAFCRNNFKSL